MINFIRCSGDKKALKDFIEAVVALSTAMSFMRHFVEEYFDEMPLLWTFSFQCHGRRNVPEDEEENAANT